MAAEFLSSDVVLPLSIRVLQKAVGLIPCCPSSPCQLNLCDGCLSDQLLSFACDSTFNVRALYLSLLSGYLISADSWYIHEVVCMEIEWMFSYQPMWQEIAFPSTCGSFIHLEDVMMIPLVFPSAYDWISMQELGAELWHFKMKPLLFVGQSDSYVMSLTLEGIQIIIAPLSQG